MLNALRRLQRCRQQCEAFVSIKSNANKCITWKKKQVTTDGDSSKQHKFCAEILLMDRSRDLNLMLSNVHRPYSIAFSLISRIIILLEVLSCVIQWFKIVNGLKQIINARADTFDSHNARFDFEFIGLSEYDMKGNVRKLLRKWCRTCIQIFENLIFVAAWNRRHPNELLFARFALYSLWIIVIMNKKWVSIHLPRFSDRSDSIKIMGWDEITADILHFMSSFDSQPTRTHLFCQEFSEIHNYVLWIHSGKRSHNNGNYNGNCRQAGKRWSNIIKKKKKKTNYNKNNNNNNTRDFN